MANMIIANGTVIELTAEEMNTVLAVVRGLKPSTGVSKVSTPTLEPAITEPKVYDHKEDTFSNFRFVQKDNTITYTHNDEKGSYVHEKVVRAALNTRIKNAGGTWDKDAKIWVFNTKTGKRNIKDATEFVANNSHELTAEELNAVRDKWTESSAKRVSKKEGK